jgi:hypothetical protein
MLENIRAQAVFIRQLFRLDPDIPIPGAYLNDPT